MAPRTRVGRATWPWSSSFVALTTPWSPQCYRSTSAMKLAKSQPRALHDRVLYPDTVRAAQGRCGCTRPQLDRACRAGCPPQPNTPRASRAVLPHARAGPVRVRPPRCAVLPRGQAAAATLRGRLRPVPYERERECSAPCARRHRYCLCCTVGLRPTYPRVLRKCALRPAGRALGAARCIFSAWLQPARREMDVHASS